MALSEETHRWYSISARGVSDSFGVDGAVGLSQAEAASRSAKYGANLVRKEKEEPLWEEFLEEAREPIILLLFVTGIFYGLFGGLEDALVIVAVIITLLSVEVVNEYRAGRAIASLRRLAEPVALVRRNSRFQEVAVEKVVPGDILLLEAGRRVPADARLTLAHGITLDESLLTGESVPVEKSAETVLPEGTPLVERSNMVFAGTTIMRGRGEGVTVATGPLSELGRIGKLAAEVEPPPTLLQSTMKELSRWMVWLALGFSTIIPVLGLVLAHQPLQQMILTGLSLAFATIPEELPIIITMVLALGAYRLSKKRAVVKHLQAVETLGAVTVIAADKTGTLTENRMELKRVYPEENKQTLLEVGALCNDAIKDGEGWAGDPLEVAFLETAARQGINADSMRRSYSFRDEFPFDNTRKMMSIVYEHGATLWAGVKGAPEEILAKSKNVLTGNQEKLLTGEEKKTLLSMEGQMASEGLRVLALAEKTMTHGSASQEEVEKELVFVGLAGFADPARPEVKDAITASRTAGIRTLMVTGDHSLTAVAVAKEIGLDGRLEVLTGAELDSISDDQLGETVERVSVFARTTPEHKLRIVRALHRAGEVVAVTGDGINDAPALAAADIGIAMGVRGTDVARETASIVLSDDNYSTIVRSVEQGRTLFANLTKGVRYYLACKVALVSITLLPALLLAPIPFAPIQIILMELFMDLAAAAAFVAEPGEPDVMKKRPRDPKAKFLDRRMVESIFAAAAGLFVAVTAAYLLTWYGTGDLARAQTVAFATWLVGHVLLALNMRSERTLLSRLGFFSNRVMLAWVLVTFAFVGVLTALPSVQGALRTTSLTLGDWGLVFPLSFVGTFWLEARKFLSLRGYGRS